MPKALAIAKLNPVASVFDICAQRGCRAFASIMETDAPLMEDRLCRAQLQVGHGPATGSCGRSAAHDPPAPAGVAEPGHAPQRRWDARTGR